MSTNIETENKKSIANEIQPKRSKFLIWITIGFIFIAFLWICYWYFFLRNHESTSDAYVNGNLININSVIQGSCVAFYADDTDLVNEGQLLVQLDSTKPQLDYETQLANLAATALKVKQLYSEVNVNRAILKTREAAFRKAEFDYQNRKNLVDAQAISTEEFIHSEETYQSALHSLKEAEYQLQVSLDAAGHTRPEQHPLIEEQKEMVRAAYYTLFHCRIYAPATGYVAQRNIQVGSSVGPARNLMAVISADAFWVDANFKETQLSDIRIGQPAEVTFDLYGSDVKFKGTVIGIASGTGSIFSIIPPQNATGNWIKVVQRLAVRIGLDPEMIKQYPLRLGLSATVDIDTSQQDLPVLAQEPSKKQVMETEVFHIPMKEINQIINRILHDNL